MTIYEVKRIHEQLSPDSFFSRETLRFFHQTLKDFRVYKLASDSQLAKAYPGVDWYRISAPSRSVHDIILDRTERYFSPASGKLYTWETISRALGPANAYDFVKLDEPPKTVPTTETQPIPRLEAPMTRSIPPGAYKAVLIQIESFVSPQGHSLLRTTWEIIEGPYKGQRIGEFTKQVPTTIQVSLEES